jgi:hypothetical protein
VGPRSIVVAFRMPLSAILRGPEGVYLARARPLCARGDALGARLVAWGATLIAMAWDLDGLEEAIDLASAVPTESLSAQDAWACGIAQGDLEALSLEGQRMHLAWGEALLAAASLARIARPGEVLIDGDVSAVRSGGLGLTGSRSASDGGQRVRGWQLDLARPWRSAPSGANERDNGPGDAWPEELASADVLELTQAAQVATRPRGPARERCRESLALAMALATLSRPEDALMEALDALARAREDADPRALAACYALLAKLYAAVGKIDAAAELRGLAAGAANLGP